MTTSSSFRRFQSRIAALIIAAELLQLSPMPVLAQEPPPGASSASSEESVLPSEDLAPQSSSSVASESASSASDGSTLLPEGASSEASSSPAALTGSVTGGSSAASSGGQSSASAAASSSAASSDSAVSSAGASQSSAPITFDRRKADALELLFSGLRDPSLSPAAIAAVLAQEKAAALAALGNSLQTLQPASMSAAEIIAWTQALISGQLSALDLTSSLVNSESQQAGNLPVPADRLQAYRTRLQAQLQRLRSGTPIVDAVQLPPLPVPKPASFSIMKPPETVESVPEPTAFLAPSDPLPPQTFWQKLVSIAFADGPDVPGLAEVRPTERIPSTDAAIAELADKNAGVPLALLNDLRAKLRYVPNYGLRAGASGCLQSGQCTDVDAAALTVAALRASGIPARVRTSAIMVSSGALKGSLGVTDVKGAITLMGTAGMTAYTVGTPVGTTFENMDFTAIDSYILQWTAAEAYVNYNDMAGTTPQRMSFDGVASDADVLTRLGDITQRQWVIIDPLWKTESVTVRPKPSIDTNAFWWNLFSTGTGSSPLQKYRSAVLPTGLDIADDSTWTKHTADSTPLSLLPPNPPYLLTSISQIQQGRASDIPDRLVPRIRIRLSNQADGSSILQSEMDGYTLYRDGISLGYQGSTQQDRDTITQYRSIEATPPELIRISPVIVGPLGAETTATPLAVGTQLLVTVSLLNQGTTVAEDQFAKNAGSSADIRISLAPLPPRADRTPVQIMLGGGSAIAEEWLYREQSSIEAVEGIFGMRSRNFFSRVAVTQQRNLAVTDGKPTSFDFDGFYVDAAQTAASVSLTGPWDTNIRNFMQLTGAQASYDESQLLVDLGLPSISTVPALQHASAYPQQYHLLTVHPGEQAVIDGFSSMPASQRDLLKAELAAGRTILTPDRLVHKDNFEGLAYVSIIDAYGSAKYAIGSNGVHNGAYATRQLDPILDPVTGVKRRITARWARSPGYPLRTSSVEMLVVASSSSSAPPVVVLLDTGMTQKTGTKLAGAAAPAPVSYNVQRVCLYPDTLPQSFTTNPEGYDKDIYGLPCAEIDTVFGSKVSHSVRLTTAAAKFYSPNQYNGWVYQTDVENKLKNALQAAGAQPDTFDFSPYSATYRQLGRKISNLGFTQNLIAFYDPSANTGRVTDEVTSAKLQNPQPHYSCGPNTSVCPKMPVEKMIGFPTGPVSSFVSPGQGFSTTRQPFVGGGIYIQTALELTYAPVYSPAVIEANYPGGLASAGGPTEDPRVEGQNTIQVMANGMQASLDAATLGSMTAVAPPNSVQLAIQKSAAMQNNEAFWEGFNDAFREQGILVDLGITAGIASAAEVIKILGPVIAEKYGAKVSAAFAAKTLSALSGVGNILIVGSLAYTAWSISPLISKCSSSTPFEGKNPWYYCGKGLAHGATMAAGAAVGAGVAQLGNVYGAGTVAAVGGKLKLFKAALQAPEVRANPEILLSPIRSLNTGARDAFYEVESFALVDDADLGSIVRNPKNAIATESVAVQVASKATRMARLSDAYTQGKSVAANLVADEVRSDGGMFVWLKNKFFRGRLVDSIQGNNLGATFPAVDKIVLDTREIVSIKSLDTSAQSYQTYSSLKSRLQDYVDVLVSKQGVFGKNHEYVQGTQFDTIMLNLVIPDRSLVPDQAKAIFDIIGYADSKNIKVFITSLSSL